MSDRPAGTQLPLSLLPDLTGQGFARIAIPAPLVSDIDRVFGLANDFFAQPPAYKHCYAMPAFVEGYRELGPEYSQVPERPDLTESFSAWNRNRARRELDAWAESCPFHGALRDASDALSEVVADVFQAIAAAWAPNAPSLRFYGGTYIQLNYYEPARHSRELLQDPHEDGHLVTLVRTNAPGLEIEVAGAFVPATCAANEVLLMPGSLLSLMTGYRIKPLYHQVRNTRRTDPRSSLLFFVNPEIDQVLKPWVSNETNAGIDVIARANAAPQQFGMPTLVDSLAGTVATEPAKRPPIAEDDEADSNDEVEEGERGEAE